MKHKLRVNLNLGENTVDDLICIPIRCIAEANFEHASSYLPSCDGKVIEAVSNAHLLTHSLIHSPTHLSTHSLTHSLTHSFTHPLTHSLIHSPTHSFTHPPTHLSTHSLIHSLTHSPTHSLIHSLTHPLTYPPTHSFTHSFTHSLTYPLTYPLTHSPTHPLTHLVQNTAHVVLTVRITWWTHLHQRLKIMKRKKMWHEVELHLWDTHTHTHTHTHTYTPSLLTSPCHCSHTHSTLTRWMLLLQSEAWKCLELVPAEMQCNKSTQSTHILQNSMDFHTHTHMYSWVGVGVHENVWVTWVDSLCFLADKTLS